MNVHFLIIIFLLAGAWPAEASHKAFFIQAINTESRAKAESAKNSLKRFGNVHIDQQDDHFIIRIGPIKDGKKAVSVRDIVKKTYPDAFIRISAARPITGMVAAPAPVSEPKSTVPVAVAQAAPPATPAAAPKNQDKVVDQPPRAGVRPTPAGKKGFFIQAINTESRTKAESIKKSLKRFGNVHIDQQDDRFIIRIGPIKDGKKAVSVRDIVKKTYPDAFIRISAARPVTGRAAAPAPVSEPKSAVPVAVAQAAPPVAPATAPKNQDKVVDQPPRAGVRPTQAGKKAFSAQTINSESRAKAEDGKINRKRLKIAPADPAAPATVPFPVAAPVHAAPVSPAPVPVPVAPAVPVANNRETPRPEIAIKPAEPPAMAPAPETLMQEAVEHYQSRRLESALEKFSLFLSLYPENSNAPSAMLAVAGILLEMKRPLSALRIYSRILERHAETPEAIESVVALADMSILAPGLKPSIAITGARWYLDPVFAYDMVLSKNPPAELTERLLLQRIVAMRSKGRCRDAYDAGSQFLLRYPQTKHLYAMSGALRSDILCIMDERIAAGDDVAVISLILNARRKGLIKMTDTNILIKAAGSYVRMDMSEEARILLNGARPFAAVQTPQIDAALQELARVGTTHAGSSPAADRWALYHAGRQQTLASNPSAAEKTFTEMKGTDQDAFWSKLADFTVKDSVRTVKYQDYLKK